jgi:LPS-assembly lipoprotein
MRGPALCALVLLALGGCGFQLRGSDVKTNVDAVYVNAAPNVDVGTQLTRRLRQSGVAVLTEPDANAVTIDLLDQQQDRRTVSTTEEAQAAEYNLELEVSYRIIAANHVELVAERLARTSRVFRLDRSNLVGTSQEQALIRNEMAIDLADQILRSLAAATRAEPR